MLVFLVLTVFTLSLVSLSIIVLSLYSRKVSFTQKKTHKTKDAITENPPLPYIFKASDEKAQLGPGSKATRLTRSIVLEVLPSDSPKWAELFKDGGPDKKGSVLDGDEEEEKKKKRKKRAKKKRVDPNTEGGGGGGGDDEEEKKKKEEDNKKEELVCLFPFTTSSSAIQRKIKNQYDQLVKSHGSTGLTLVQVGQFVNCLVEAKKELQHRSEVIQRKFTITKALLLKADRSSFDRLRKQIYKLELEQKRLEEDAFVYNWLQQQLKLSPAYKKILEIGASIEMTDKLGGEEVESDESDVADISFEELLAQEKKDAFWQRNGKTRSSC